MQSHPTISFANGTTNVNVGDRADVVIILGRDNPDIDDLQEQYVRIREYCENSDLKYVILGDGKNAIYEADIAKLPHANHVVVSGHGEIGKDTNNATAHIIHLTAAASDCSLDIIKAVQARTKSKKILFCACFAGRVNEDIRTKGKIADGTELLIPSPPDTDSTILNNFIALNYFIREIAAKKPAEVQLSETIGILMKTIPETMTYGKKIKKEFSTFTIRREDQVTLGESEPAKYYEYNKKRLNEYLRHNGIKEVSLPAMTHEESVQYRKNAVLHHIWACNNDAIEKLLQLDEDLFVGIGASPLHFALINHSSHALMKKSPEEMKQLTMTLIAHDPQGIIAYFKDPEILNDDDLIYHRSVVGMLIEIADETGSPHVILPLIDFYYDELMMEREELHAAQQQLLQMQLRQDPQQSDEQYFMATSLMEHADKHLLIIAWIDSHANLLTPAQITEVEELQKAVKYTSEHAKHQREQAMLQCNLHQQQLELNHTLQGLQELEQIRGEHNLQLSPQEYQERLDALHHDSQLLLSDARLQLENTTRLFLMQQELSQGQKNIPQLATVLLQLAREQVIQAHEQAAEVKTDMEIHALASQPAAMPSQKSDHHDGAEKARLEKLIELELNKMPGIIANIRKISDSKGSENSNISHQEADKRMKKISGYLEELQLLGSEKVEHFSRKLGYFAGMLSENAAEKNNSSATYKRWPRPT